MKKNDVKTILSRRDCDEFEILMTDVRAYIREADRFLDDFSGTYHLQSFLKHLYQGTYMFDNYLYMKQQLEERGTKLNKARRELDEMKECFGDIPTKKGE